MSIINQTKLSVNINKLATIRNARGGNNPNLLYFAKRIEDLGAHGITIHPRPDERHIRFSDVYDLKKTVKTEFNIEGYPSDSFIKMVLDVKPEQVTLVPDPPHVLTSNNGWDTITHLDFLKSVIAKFKNANIRTSIFLNPDPSFIESAHATGTDRIELYTEGWCQACRFAGRIEHIVTGRHHLSGAIHVQILDAHHLLNRAFGEQDRVTRQAK